MSLETVTKVTYFRSVLCGLLHPAAECQLISTFLVLYFTFGFFCGLVYNFCLDMLEVEEAQGILGYYPCFIFSVATS